MSKEKHTIAVLGVNGMLGYAVNKYFKDKNYKVLEISRENFDILRDTLDKLQLLVQDASVVINCTGIIKPRIDSMKPEDVLLVNGRFPKNLAKLCKQNGQKCFHITTDCVYSGNKGQYTENDYFDIKDMYGLSKNAGESTECMTIRTSIIGEEKSNKYSLLEWARSQQGKEVFGFTNHRWNGVTTVYLAEIMELILKKELYKEGIFHVYSPDIVNKKELLEIIDNIYALDLTIIPKEAEEAIDRSLSSTYELAKQVASKSITQQIREMKDFFSSF